MTEIMGRRLSRLALSAAAFALATGAAGAQTGEVTFSRDVAPILQRGCEGCHRAGQMGPMSLTTYEEVRPWARAIRTKVVERVMPPWHLDKTVGIQAFENDISLTDAEIDTIARWVDAGAPRGNPADLPARIAWPAEDVWRPHRPLRPRAGSGGQLRALDPDRGGAGPVVAADHRDRVDR